MDFDGQPVVFEYERDFSDAFFNILQLLTLYGIAYGRIDYQVAGPDLDKQVPVVLESLTAGASYSWRVRVKYGTDKAWSEWSSPVEFTFGLPKVESDPF